MFPFLSIDQCAQLPSNNALPSLYVSPHQPQEPSMQLITTMGEYLATSQGSFDIVPG